MTKPSIEQGLLSQTSWKRLFKSCIITGFIDYDSSQSDFAIKSYLQNVSREAENKPFGFSTVLKITELTSGIQGEYITTQYDVQVTPIQELPLENYYLRGFCKHFQNFYKYNAFTNVTHRFSADFFLMRDFRLMTSVELMMVSV
ncbi:MAG: hypothetical protein IPN18_14535 [Ignavibacteriales bacterium]|nr:hypothetical protein [Ignavibacteriales bacterium]